MSIRGRIRQTAGEVAAKALDRDDLPLVDRIVLALCAALQADLATGPGERPKENLGFGKAVSEALRRLERRGFLVDPDRDQQYGLKHSSKWPQPR